MATTTTPNLDNAKLTNELQSDDARYECGDYGITVTWGRGTPSYGAAKTKGASVGRLSTGEHLYTGRCQDAAAKFLGLLAADGNSLADAKRIA